MSPSFRRAHEKVRPLGGGRRGRREEVPLEIYHELDDLFEQVDGLRQIVGVTRKTVAALSGAPPEVVVPPQPTKPPPDQVIIENAELAFLPNSASFIQQARTRTREIAWDTILLRALMTVEVTGGGTSQGTIFGTANGNSIVAPHSSFVVTNNQTFEFINFLQVAGKTFAPLTLFQFGFNRILGEPNTRVAVTLEVRQTVIIQGSS